jgi:hypothetical protein
VAAVRSRLGAPEAAERRSAERPAIRSGARRSGHGSPLQCPKRPGVGLASLRVPPRASARPRLPWWGLRIVNEPICVQIVRRGPIATKGGFTTIERPCGAPATVESGQALCRTHREQQDREAFSSHLDEIEALRRAVGAARELEAVKRYYPGEELYDSEEHKGSRVEIVAFRLRDGSPFPIAYPFVYEAFPRIGPCIVARWRFRYPGMPGILEVRWDRHRRGRHRGRGGRREEDDERLKRSVILHGLSVSPQLAVRLLGLWTTETEKAERARRPGRRRRTVEKHPAKIALAKRAWAIHEREPKLGWDKIAARVGASGKTLQRYCEEDRLHEF